MLDVENIRKDFPILKRKVHGKRLIYFDNAATSQKPIQVISAVSSFYEKMNANIGRSVHDLGVSATERYEEARRIIAGFIGASREELVFVKNSTEGINLAAYSLLFSGKIRRDSKIVITRMEHHSNILPWNNVAKLAGAQIDIVEVDDRGRLLMEDLVSKIDEKTSIVAFTHVSNVTGIVNPAKEICRIAHEKGALCLVDGAQSAPHIPVDVKSLDADFFAFSGHKMLGPMGIGGLYIRKELAEELEPPFPGGGAITNVKCSGNCKAEWLPPPNRFEAGTPNVAGAIGLMEAVKYLKRIGLRDIEEHEKKLATYALERLRELKVEIYGPLNPNERLGVISFNLRGIAPHDLAALLDMEGIAVRSGHHCALPLIRRLGAGKGTVRASFYLYNTLEEVDTMIKVLEKVEKMLS